MSARILRTPRAEGDLIEIWTYIAADNPRAADRLLDTIEAKLKVLASSPLMGAAREDIAGGMRHAPVGRYLILYRALPDGIDVVRVIHTARRLDRIEL